MLNPLILNICRLLQRKKTSIPTVGQWAVLTEKQQARCIG